MQDYKFTIPGRPLPRKCTNKLSIIQRPKGAM